MLNKFICSFLFGVFVTSSAAAQSYPESVAFETSMEAAAQILSSPALPSLDNDVRFSITPVLGTVNIKGANHTMTSTSTGASTVYEVNGAANGQVGGLTFNYSSNGDFGLFAISSWNQVSGNIGMKYNGATAFTDVRDIRAESFVGAFGATYRMIGDAKSKFAMGLFGGPAFIISKTSGNINHSGGITKAVVNPEVSGTYVGIQFMFRFGEFRINPYANVLGSFEQSCLQPQYSGSTYTASKFNTCVSGERGISTLAMMGGAGINVGYGRLQFGLVKAGGSLSPGLKSTPLMLSFRISL